MTDPDHNLNRTSDNKLKKEVGSRIAAKPGNDS